jgi:hypothetical protein
MEEFINNRDFQRKGAGIIPTNITVIRLRRRITQSRIGVCGGPHGKKPSR